MKQLVMMSIPLDMESTRWMVLDLALFVTSTTTLLLVVVVEEWCGCDAATVFLNIVVIVTCLCYGALVRCYGMCRRRCRALQLSLKIHPSN